MPPASSLPPSSIPPKAEVVAPHIRPPLFDNFGVTVCFRDHGRKFTLAGKEYLRPEPTSTTQGGPVVVNNRYYLRGLSWLGLVNTALAWLFNRVLVRCVDDVTGETVKWLWDKATDHLQETG